MLFKRKYLPIIVLIAASLACTMPTATATTPDASNATNFPANAAATLPANTVSTLPVITPIQGPPQGSASETNTPPPNIPTTPPTQPSSNSGSADTTPPVLANAQGDTQGYYPGGCGPTTIAISVDATDNSGNVTQVWVNYQLVSLQAQGMIGGTQWYQTILQPAGGSRYEGFIDLTIEAPTELQGYDGSLQYQIYAQDAAGNITILPDGYIYGAEVYACNGQNPPAGGNNGGSVNAPTIDNIVIYPQTEVYYGICGNEETRLNVQATIEPMDHIALAEIYYGYSDSTGSLGTYVVNMYQLGIGDYAGDIDVGTEAENLLNGAAGQVDFYIHAETTDGQTVDSGWMSLSVLPCGGALGQPPMPGNGTSTVRFYNNASHPVVELLIDGYDVIQSESQSIPVGGYLDVTVSAGDHSYQPGVGYWQGGGKVAIYPLANGYFNDADGSVTLTDPSLGQMLTNYGQGDTYTGMYWDENAIDHCATFVFDANGGFSFYLDGTYDESGTYTLLYRDPSTYSVVFRVTGNTSQEQFDATFYYTGAMAGTIEIPNGPTGWEWIDYVLNGSCP